LNDKAVAFCGSFFVGLQCQKSCSTSCSHVSGDITL